MSVVTDVATLEARLARLAAEPSRNAGVRPAVPRGSSVSFDALVRHAAREAGIEPALVRAVAENESGFDPLAVSPTGAAGLMQLMPATAVSLGVTDRYDPVQNVRAGAAYLRSLLDRFGNDLPLALAAYNAGPGAVERSHGVPPYPETRQYVARVLATYRRLLGR